MRTIFAALVLAGAFVIGNQGGAMATPQNGKKICHQEKVCVTVPASCNPSTIRTRPCPPGSTSPHQSCSMKIVCVDP